MNSKRYWVCGKQTVCEIIKNKRRTIYKIVLSEKNSISNNSLFNDYKNIITFASIKQISKILDNNEIRHQGFAALISPLEADLSKQDYSKLNNLVALNNVSDTRNIGSIIRTCAAFGVEGLLVDKKYFKEDSLAMNKTACGGTEKLNIYQLSNIKYGLEVLKKQNFKIISFSSNSNKIIDQTTFAEKNVLIFGSEDVGISNNILNKSDEIIKINTVDNESLNVACSVSSALTVLLYLKKFGK